MDGEMSNGKLVGHPEQKQKLGFVSSRWPSVASLLKMGKLTGAVLAQCAHSRGSD